MFPDQIHYKIAKELHNATFPSVDVSMVKRILMLNFNSHQKKKFDSVIEAYFEQFGTSWLEEIGQNLEMESFLEIYNLITFHDYYDSINDSINKTDTQFQKGKGKDL